MDAYLPQNPVEKGFYDYLWDVANNRQPGSDPSGGGELSGAAAVQFLTRSSVDRGFLKQIWSLSTPSSTMNLPQFYTALRFITMIQNGEIPISKERLISTSKENLGFPKFSGIEPPQKLTPAPVVPAAPVSFTAAPPPVAAVPTGGNVSGGLPAFAMTPAEHSKYHTLFLSYDTNHDGYLTRDKAIPILSRSGLDIPRVEMIFQLSDEDRDGRLSSKEFSAAFHFIVCVTKRGQPMPPPGSGLPQPLQLFMANAPAIPPAAPEAAPARQLTPSTSFSVVQPVQQQQQPAVVAVPPQPAPVVATVSSAFDAFDSNPVAIPPAAALPPLSTASTLPASSEQVFTSNLVSSSAASIAMEGELHTAVDGIKSASRKAITTQEVTLTTADTALSSLQAIKQRLATEKIALEAAVTNAIASNAEMQMKIDKSTIEITQLTNQVQSLREELVVKQHEKVDFSEKLLALQTQKSTLQHEIEVALTQLQNGHSTANTTSNTISNTTSQVEVVSLTKEIETLKMVLSSVLATVHQTQNLGIGKKNEGKEEEKLKAEISRLKGEKEDLLKKLLTHASVAAVPVSMKQPLLASNASAAFDDSEDVFSQVSSPVKGNNSSNSAFGDDDPFGSITATVNSTHGSVKSGFVPFEEEEEANSPFTPITPVTAAAPSIVSSEPEFAPLSSFGSVASPVTAATPTTAAAAVNKMTVAEDDAFAAFGDDDVPVVAVIASPPPEQKKKVAKALPPTPSATAAVVPPAVSAAAAAAVVVVAEPEDDPFAAAAASVNVNATVASDDWGAAFPAPSTAANTAVSEDDVFGAVTVPTTSNSNTEDDFFAAAASAAISSTAADGFDAFGTSSTVPTSGSEVKKQTQGEDAFAAFGDDSTLAAATAAFGDFDAFGSSIDPVGGSFPAVKAREDDPFGSAVLAGDEDPFAAPGVSTGHVKPAEDDPFASFE